tara:strand:- start:1664 stop:2572 length:909 start_codon:yes stop_codon:yes gene_type:complete
MKKVFLSKYAPLFLALPFLGLYFIIRALPVEQCDFLHEETYNLDGELDYCGPGDTGFIDLSLRRWPMSLSFRALDPLIIDKPCRFEMNIKQADGSPLSDEDVALSHNRKIHLLAIDPSLEDYQHLHPVPDPLFKGIWRFTLTPKKAGKYRVYLDLIPLRSPRRVLLGASFNVPGHINVPSPRSDGYIITKNNRIFILEAVENDESISEMQLKFSALDEKGNHLPLRPVMGAFAHLVAFEPDTDGFAHLHPLEYEPPKSKEDIRQGPLTFSFKSPKSGIYRLWAQIKVGEDEEESFLPFDIRI